MEEEILAEGAQLIWVLEQDQNAQPGTADTCLTFVAGRGSDAGLCVGDAETEPVAGVFDEAPFATGRGFDMIVRRSDMEILFVTDHGTPAGNDNLTGAEILDAVRDHKP